MSRVSGVMLAAALFVSAAFWMLAADRRGTLPPGDFTPRPPIEWTVTRVVRDDALRRAAVRVPPHARPAIGTDRTDDPLTCNFISGQPSGTSPKFDCVLADGQIVKVKYGRNPEIQAEVAASRLLAGLGYATDAVTIVPRIRCYGCPRFPYLAMRLRESPFTSWLAPARYDGGYTDFDVVSTERRFPAPALQTPDVKGWSWYELDESLAAPDELDAFRLLALFLAHWDNKAENQRLVCLSDTPSPHPPHSPYPPDPPHPPQPCPAPLVMIQDLGATFGPYKVNLTAWWDAKIWADAAGCVASMRNLPFRGSTFGNVRISEAGRRRFLEQFEAFTDADLRTLFSAARFPEYQSPTADDRDLQHWTAAFRHRVQMIRGAGPCPDS